MMNWFDNKTENYTQKCFIAEKINLLDTFLKLCLHQRKSFRKRTVIIEIKQANKFQDNIKLKKNPTCFSEIV